MEFEIIQGWKTFMAQWRISRLRRSRLLRRAGLVILLALLLTLATVANARPAFASGGGPGTVYTHTSTSANTYGDYTLLDNSFTDNNPNAIIEVTANWDPNGIYTGFDNRQVGVWYDSWAGKWGIFNEDGSSMPVGASFNVDAVPTTSSPPTFVQTTTTANTSGYITYLNNATLNGNPSANLIVTQNWNPGGIGGVYNNHAIGIWYDYAVGEWTIYNEDRSAIPSGASFNVEMAIPSYSLIQVASSSNISGDSTCLSPSDIPGNFPQGAILFITHVYSGYFTDVSAVWFNLNFGEWCIFDGSYNNMPSGATFTVAIGAYVVK
jgi:hypothetical protein